ncbi:MAG: Co2+/Mg2+ efflux protein ApaG [Gammaproteobacteria bacterium]|nr:MAG: Co2+/Mg2+ efflux protein ApaG [Gammaproteobacteria bacterium]
MPDPRYSLNIEVQTRYLQEESVPEDNRFVFAYTITIQNTGDVAARLMKRAWQITDSNGNIQEVTGEGVVGEQPRLEPGEGFRYSSGAVLETEVGTMSGSYTMLADDGLEFDVEIPKFTLSTPRTLH